MHHGMSATTCPICGGGPGHHMGGPGMKGIKGMFKIIPWKVLMHGDELGLSEEQIAALRDRHTEARKQMIQIGSQIKLGMIDVENAVMQEEIDMGTAEAKIRDVAKLKGDLFVAMVQAMNDMRHILTHDQRKKVKAIIMSWLKKSEMHGMGMEEGQEGESGEESEE